MCSHALQQPPDSQPSQQLGGASDVSSGIQIQNSSQPKISSRYRGLCWDKKHRAWRVRIFYGGKQRHVGRFKDDLMAARAYDKAAVYLYGERAILNFTIEECLADPSEISGFITLAKEQTAAALTGATNASEQHIRSQQQLQHYPSPQQPALLQQASMLQHTAAIDASGSNAYHNMICPSASNMSHLLVQQQQQPHQQQRVMQSGHIGHHQGVTVVLSQPVGVPALHGTSQQLLALPALDATVLQQQQTWHAQQQIQQAAAARIQAATPAQQQQLQVVDFLCTSVGLASGVPPGSDNMPSRSSSCSSSMIPSCGLDSSTSSNIAVQPSMINSSLGFAAPAISGQTSCGFSNSSNHPQLLMASDGQQALLITAMPAGSTVMPSGLQQGQGNTACTNAGQGTYHMLERAIGGTDVISNSHTLLVQHAATGPQQLPQGLQLVQYAPLTATSAGGAVYQQQGGGQQHQQLVLVTEQPTPQMVPAISQPMSLEHHQQQQAATSGVHPQQVVQSPAALLADLLANGCSIGQSGDQSWIM